MSGAHGATPADATSPQTGGDQPARDLADLWTMLDVLPRASSSVDMAATTVDMVAVAVGGAADRAGSKALPRGSRGRLAWLLPAAAVCASLVAGVVVGRITAPDPDLRILESLPLIRHVGILQEAGTPKFLKALAARRLPLPFRLPQEMARNESREFDEAILDLETDHAIGTAARPLVAGRRADLDALAADERDTFERSLAVFQTLSTAQRRNLGDVASVLADPRRQELRDAARSWHLLIAASDPADRKNIVELDDEGRLEWVDRRLRLREWDRTDRRGVPPSIEGPMPPRGPGVGPVGAAGEGRPRWQGPRGEGGPQGGGRGEAPGRSDGPGRGEGRSRGEFRPRGDEGRGEAVERGGPRLEARPGERPGDPRPDVAPPEPAAPAGE
jgi:hypothetical protein